MYKWYTLEEIPTPHIKGKKEKFFWKKQNPYEEG
jgi:hypothetical protein